MKSVLIPAAILLALVVDFALPKPQSNHSLGPQISKRLQEALPPLPTETRQRPPTASDRPSWSNPPTVQWIDDPPPGSSTNLLPVLYLMAPLVVTAMLMPIGATIIAAIVMLKVNNPATAPGRFKALLFSRDEEVAPIFKILEQNLMDLSQKLEEALLKYENKL